MFNIEDLAQIYNQDYFIKTPDNYVWVEKQNNPTALSEVNFLFRGGDLSFVKSKLLKETNDSYRKDATETLNLRRICDGILFLDRENDHFMVIIEVKSGFGDVKEKAISQIPSSYIKIKSLLNDFSSYHQEDYREFGLIVSYPYIERPKTDGQKNPEIMASKRKMIQDKNEIVKSKYNKLLRDTQTAEFIGGDFNFNEFQNISPCLFFDSLHVRHCPVKDKCVSAVVDLDEIIQALP